MPCVLSQSLEDYLEAVFSIAESGSNIAVSDIARWLGVAKPSVTGAMQRLENLGLVRHRRYDYVELTAAGRRRAQAIAGRHDLLRRFLRDVLGVGEKTADRDACAIEHHASDETIGALMRFMKHRSGGPHAPGERGAE